MVPSRRQGCVDSCFWAAELPKSVSTVPKCPASVLVESPHSISSHQSSSGHSCYWPLSRVLVLAAALEHRRGTHRGGTRWSSVCTLGAPAHESNTSFVFLLSASQVWLLHSFLLVFLAVNICHAQKLYLAYSQTGITWAGWTAIGLCFLCQDWSQAESGIVLGSPWIRAAVWPRSLAVGYPGQNGPAGYAPQPPGLGSRSPLGRSGPGSGAVCWLREKSAACTGPGARR